MSPLSSSLKFGQSKIILRYLMYCRSGSFVWSLSGEITSICLSNVFKSNLLDLICWAPRSHVGLSKSRKSSGWKPKASFNTRKSSSPTSLILISARSRSRFRSFFTREGCSFPKEFSKWRLCVPVI